MIKRKCSQLIEEYLEYLEYFPCVALIGARQSRKTILLGGLDGKWNYFDLEKTDDFKAIIDTLSESGNLNDIYDYWFRGGYGD